MRTTPFLLGALAVCGCLAAATPAAGIDRMDLQDTVSQEPAIPSPPALPSLPPGSASIGTSTDLAGVESSPAPDYPLPPLAPPPWASKQSTANVPVPTVSTTSGGIKPPVLKSPSDIKKPRITQPQIEEDYKRWMLQEQTKKAQRKRLGESIMDEIKRYGLLILLGFVAILVLFALKKESAPTPPASAAGGGDKGTGEPKDIWKDEF